MKSKQNYWILGFIIFGVIFISGCADEKIDTVVEEDIAEEEKFEEPEEPYVPEQRGEEEQEEIQEQPSPVFTHHITDLSKISEVVLPGSVSVDTFAEHSYLHIKESVDRVPIYAPIDSELTEIGFSGPSIYFLVFRINDEITYYLDGIVEENDEIKAANPFSQPNEGSQTEDPIFPVFVEGGELLGYTNRDAGVRVWDFGVVNKSNRNIVANAERHEDQHGPYRYLTGVCPYDFYPEDMKKEYLSLHAIWDDKGFVEYREIECRGPSNDVPGTAAGYWFLDSGTNDIYGPKFVIAADIDGYVKWGGVGDGAQEGQAVDPAEIRVGEEACYSENRGWVERDDNVFIKLLSETELGVFYGEGDCPTTFPEEGYKVYVR